MDKDIEIVAEAGSGHEILELALTTEMDAACMDINMPGMNGIEATQRLLAIKPTVRVIGLSAYADPLYVEAMLNAGAVGYFTKDDAGGALLQAIHEATHELPCFGADIAAPVATNARAEPLPDETEYGANIISMGTKEYEMLRLIASGAGSAQIAQSLSMDNAMVDVYCRNIMRKLKLNNDAELKDYALELQNNQ